jgi:uncharacterized lipoprotein YehR (DUF1307 family)
MKNVLSSAVSISIVSILSMSLVGCGPSQSSQTNENSTPSASATAETPKEEKGLVRSYDTKLSLREAKEFDDDNYLRIGTNNELKISSSGYLDKSQEEKDPAGGEKFHAINYTYKAIENSKAPAKITLTINGSTKPLVGSLYKEGTLLVSAPENAEIELSIQIDGVTQTIGFKDAKRKTKGVAETWYQSPVGKLTDANVSIPVNVAKYVATLNYTVKDATRTPYSASETLGWADNGKKTWVIIEIDTPEWTISKDSITKTKRENKISLKDAQGNSYAPIVSNSGSKSQIAFAVDPKLTDFTLHTESSVSLDLFGESVGATGPVVSDQVKISFE